MCFYFFLVWLLNTQALSLSFLLFLHINIIFQVLCLLRTHNLFVPIWSHNTIWKRYYILLMSLKLSTLFDVFYAAVVMSIKCFCMYTFFQ